MRPNRAKKRGPDGPSFFRRALTIALLAVFVLLPTAEAAVYRQGSSGEEVKKIQTKLKEQGHYDGRVDGLFGPKTTAAVKQFQQKNNLAADGVVGPATMKALGISSGSGSSANSSEQNNLNLMARIISAEARGEPFNGQVAVGAVILNRVDHPSFPNTIYGVIYQPGAFSCLTDGQADQPVADSAYRAAREALNGSDPAGGAIYYYNPSTATNQWIQSRPLLVVIGKHRFCA